MIMKRGIIHVHGNVIKEEIINIIIYDENVYIVKTEVMMPINEHVM
jgi:hypothetical protein